MVGTGSLHMLSLQRRRRCALLMRRCLFCLGRAGRYSTGAAVIADTIHRGVVNYGPVVNIVNVVNVHVVHRAVIVEGPVIPISAAIADTTIAEAIVDATVEADVRTPVATIPGVGVGSPAPITRGPEQTNPGGLTHVPGAQK